MKTTQECWQALIDGETLICPTFGNKIVMKDGEPVWADTNMPVKQALSNYHGWNIYTPTKWFNNIPEHGVLCWYENGVSIIYNKASLKFVKHNGENISLATPLTKQEIQTLLDNVPEDKE